MAYLQLPRLAANAALLLIEPDPSRSSEWAAQMDGSPFYVTRVNGPGDIPGMRGAFDFSVVVLSDGMGLLALQACAQMVRKQWPKARIVLVGQAPDQFDDHLYDESIVHASDGGQLLAVLEKVTDGGWRRKSHEANAAWLVRPRLASPSKQNGAIPESDPTKTVVPVRADTYVRDRPANVQLRHGVR